MEYPVLLLAIRAAGLKQFEVAARCGIREGRLSQIIRRGGANPHERAALSEALDVPEPTLFAPDVRGVDIT